jgi:excisionase family DNA binding protein
MARKTGPCYFRKSDPAYKNPPTLDSLPELLTAQQAALVLGLSSNTVLNHLASGVIPSVRIGRIYRIPKATLLATTR